jgi:hypothetical protein
MGLLDRSNELVSEPKLMTPVVGDRKIHDFIPAQKIEMKPLFKTPVPSDACQLPIASGYTGSNAKSYGQAEGR